MNEFREDRYAFVALTEKRTLAEAVADKENMPEPTRSYPYCGVWKMDTIMGTEVHVFSNWTDQEMVDMGWKKVSD